MAHSLSAKKRIRQNEKRRQYNRAKTTEIKSVMRDCREAIAGGVSPASEGKVKEALRMLDRESASGLIHKNTAVRRKSRLMKRLNQRRSGASKP